jgi:hypothetical protein
MRVPPSFDVLNPVDVVELGERAAMGLHGENRGLPLRQRLPVITGRKPPRMRWFPEYGDSPMPERLRLGYDVLGAW